MSLVNLNITDIRVHFDQSSAISVGEYLIMIFHTVYSQFLPHIPLPITNGEKTLNYALYFWCFQDLQRRRGCCANCIIQYTNYLRKIAHVRGINLKSHIFSPYMDLSETDFNKPDFVSIHIALKGRLVAHDVLFFYDSKNNCLEFFDAMGKSLHELQNKQVFMLADPISFAKCQQMVLSQLRTTYNVTDIPIKENRVRVQHDFHNCSIYELNYVERRLNGESMEDITAIKPLSYQDANFSIRQHMMLNLLVDRP